MSDCKVSLKLEIDSKAFEEMRDYKINTLFIKTIVKF